MNRPQDEARAQAGPQDDAWEEALEAAFFDDDTPLDAMPTTEEIDDPDTLERPVLPALDVPIDPPDLHDPPAPPAFAMDPLPVTEPTAPQRVATDADAPVVQVVPRWVWPTVGLFGALAVGGVAFGLGVAWATLERGDAPVEAAVTATVTPAAATEAPADEPSVAQEPARATPPPTTEDTTPAPRAKKKPSRRRPKKPRPLAPAPADASSGPHVPAPPAPVTAPAPGVMQPAPAAPTSVADLPTAVPLGALKPGAAL
jgi:hypothetical protein